MMLQRQGSIVNVSSVMSEGGWVGQSNYAASKAAINAFSRTAAVELARFHIRVNAILPGFSPTDLVSGILKEPKRITQQIALKRFAEPEEIAKCAIFLACEDSSYVTGSTLIVDGGTRCQIGIGKQI
jgi:3-oxoacyl-[acyl-carrier protein] reductase